MRILVFGGKGTLGSDLVPELMRRRHQVGAPESSQADVTDPTAVAEWVSKGWDWVVNLAAYTAVDRAENEEELAVAVNTLGAGYVANAAAIYGPRVLHVGTDFVFGGEKEDAYSEEDETNPLNAYARSKRGGEEEVLLSGARPVLVRTSWLFGPTRGSFPKTILNAAMMGKPLRVVADQYGTPTYTLDLASTIADMIERNVEPGIYHAAGPDVMTWHELATRTLKSAGLDQPIDPIATEDWPTPATRPKNSALSVEKLRSLDIYPMRPIDEALADFVARIRETAAP